MLIGSFLTCFKNRLDNLGSILVGRSMCPKCRHRLGFLDLFPVLSFIFARGRCRYCKKRISLEYPIIEILTALLALFVYSYFGLSAASVILFISLCLLLVSSVLDIESREVHFGLLIAGIISAFIFRLALEWSFPGALNALLGMTVFSIIPFGFSLISKERWMGFGDGFFALWLGAICGYPSSLVGIALAFLFGSFFGIIVMSVKRGGKGSNVLPFGPFLSLAGLVALVYGEIVIAWYLKFFNL